MSRLTDDIIELIQDTAADINESAGKEVFKVEPPRPHPKSGGVHIVVSENGVTKTTVFSADDRRLAIENSLKTLFGPKGSWEADKVRLHHWDVGRPLPSRAKAARTGQDPLGKNRKGNGHANESLHEGDAIGQSPDPLPLKPLTGIRAALSGWDAKYPFGALPKLTPGAWISSRTINAGRGEQPSAVTQVVQTGNERTENTVKRTPSPTELSGNDEAVAAGETAPKAPPFLDGVSKPKSGFASAFQKWERDYPTMLPPPIAATETRAGAGAIVESPGNSNGLDTKADHVTAGGEVPLTGDAINTIASQPEIIAPDEAPRGTMPNPSEPPPSTEKLASQGSGPLHHLIRSGAIAPDDSWATVVQKVTILLNAYPPVAAKNGAFDIEPNSVDHLLKGPSRAFNNSAMETNPTAYRIWQMVDRQSAEAGIDRPNLYEFWGHEPQPTGNLRFQIGREVYRKILDILDRNENRHIQNSSHLNQGMGMGVAAFSSFLTKLQYAYVRDDNASAAGMSLEDARTSPNVVASGLLQELARSLNCKADEIITRDEWHRAIVVTPPDTGKSSRFIPKGEFQEEKLSPESAAVLQRIRDSGFKDLEDLRDLMNDRLREVSPPLPAATYQVLISNIRRSVEHRQPFGKWSSGIEGVIYRRMTEVVNERREQNSLSPLTTAELFGVDDKRSASPAQLLKTQANENFLTVLAKPENRPLLAMHRIAMKAGVKEDEIIGIINDARTAYTVGAGDEIHANPVLDKLSKALNANPADIVTHDMWRQGIALGAKDTPAPVGGEKLPDNSGAAAPPDATGTPFEGLDLPPMFLKEALRAHQEAEDRQRAPERKQFLALLAGVIDKTKAEGLPTLGESTVENLAAAALRRASASPLQPPPQPIPPPVRPEPDTPSAFRASDASAIENSFVNAAVEVFALYRKLHDPAMAIELGLLDKVEGLSRRQALKISDDADKEPEKKGELIDKVASEFGLDEGEAKDIVGDLKAQITRTASRVAGVTIEGEDAMDALRLYHREVTGRVLAIKWLEAGRDDAHDEAIGKALPRPLTGPEVKGVRERFFAHMAAKLQGVPDVAA